MKLSRESIVRVLSKYLPPDSLETCVNWVTGHNIHVRITRSRATKFGDYRPLQHSKGHQITINHDLNPYAFLITFVHEVAHLHCELTHSGRIAPHGREWKDEFSLLLEYFLRQDIFPSDLVGALKSYISNPAASSCSDHDLLRALRKYDKKNTLHVVHLEDLPKDAVFRLYSSRSGQLFKKGDKIRTRFHCLEMRSRREYFVSPLAEVVVQQVPEEGLQMKVSGI